MPGLSQAQFALAPPTLPSDELPKEDPVRRCVTVEMDSALRAQFPDMGNDTDFERWMGRAQRQVAPLRSVATLPVIVHVVHDGSNSGTGYNLSAARIQSQIDILNQDFRRLNADTTNTPSQYHTVASDLQIEFCLATVDPNGIPLAEPGIHRIDKVAQGWTAGSVTPSYVNSTIKPATQWDPHLYLNVWVVPLANNKLGFAQFPQQSGLPGLNYFNAAQTDGIVVTTNAFGANPNFAPYHLGRTATHEMGHFLGLRHIWGDGGCGVDDYCADTPEADQSHMGCQAGVQACGNRAMVENFMDYSDDGCMNLFTADQKARVSTVLQMSPRRASLLASDRCMPLGPELYFSTGTMEMSEALADNGSCGSYLDVNLTVMLARPTTTGGMVELQVQGSNATEGEDYAFPQGPTVTFAPGQDTAENLVLRLFDDGYFEGEEKIYLKLDLVGGGTSDLLLLPDHDSLVITMPDNELNPNQDLRQVLLFEDFESSGGSLPAGWQVSNTVVGNNQWVINGIGALSGSQSAHISDGSGTYQYDKFSSTITYLMTPTVQAGAQPLTLTFDYKVRGELYFNVVYDFGQVFYTLDGTTFVPLTDKLYYQDDTTQHLSLTLPDSLAGQSLRIAFGWFNDHVEGFDPPFMIDNVEIFSGRGEVASTLGATREHYLGPYATVHFYDENNGQLMASIHNLSAHDYGCTSIEIDRTGLGVVPFLEKNNSQNGLMAKTVQVIPSNNAPGNNGLYRITLYFTPEEVSSYEAATGKSWLDSRMIRTDSAISTVGANSTAQSVGMVQGQTVFASQMQYAYALMAEFQGHLGSMGIGQPGQTRPTTFPIQYEEFEVWEEGSHGVVSWLFSTDNGVNRFWVERSTDGLMFENVAEIIPQDRKSSGRYVFADSNAVAQGQQTIFYRVRGMDIDGGEYLTDVRSLAVRSRQVTLKAFPVPFTQELTLEIEQPRIHGEVTVTVHDLTGRQLYQTERNLSRGTSQWSLPLAQLSPGVYLVQVRSGQEIAQKRVVKR